MKIKHLCFMLFGIAVISIVASPVLACGGPPPPGYSPGYWKHQFNAYLADKGKAQETWGNLVMWTGLINGYYGIAPPYFYDYPLPPVSSLNADGVDEFTTNDAYIIFNDKDWKSVWKGLANWYNWAAGLGPY